MAQFIAEHTDLDLDGEDVFFYHGTNCYRRWEIKRLGMIEPGRSNYSFFCNKISTALNYARAACMRDMSNHSPNSLICEPVVLKVRFNRRTWVQVDFWQSNNPSNLEDKNNLVFAVLGPISADLIVDVLHCNHARRLCSSGINSLTNDALFKSLQRLREKLSQRRADAWILRQVGNLTQNMSVKMSGGTVPNLTLADSLKRLRQTSVQLES